MSAVEQLFTRLAQLLPAATLEELRTQYRADAAAASRSSRKRSHDRQEAARLAREQQTARNIVIGDYRYQDGDGRRELRAAWPALADAFDAIERREDQEWS